MSPPSMPNLSREGPFDVHQVTTESGASPRVLDSLPGCQYRMTLYDVANDRLDSSPAYGIHLHNPRLLEYVGVPESARLLSRTPEYWLHHMGREKTLAAALQLQHDAGLIMLNIQVLGQFVTSLNQDGIGGHAGGVRSGAISFGGTAIRDAVSPCSSDKYKVLTSPKVKLYTLC